MKWIATRKANACAKLPIAELLQDRLDVATTAKVVAHLDHCEDCQRRITELSANAQWWREAAVCLENAALDESDAENTLLDEFNEPHGPSAEQSLIQCGLMTKSSKPEMIGTIGRYEIRRVIGTGGTGIVLQAVDCELDRIVALKVLSPTLASNGAARRRFSREGQAAASVSHDNVVAIYHVESAGPAPYLVMQYVDGCSLQEWVMRSGPMDTTSALRMIAQLAAALEAAHEQGLVHRDVKPANILVSAAGQRFWITDFGLARAVDDASLTRTGFIAGTPHYMSPEQARGESVGSRSDLFGLGSVLYFSLTGRPPFRADRSLAILNRICNEKHRSVREVNPDVSLAAATMVDRLLQKVPQARFQTAEEVRQECLRLLTHTDEVTAGAEVVPAVRKKYGRLKLLTATAVSLLAIGTITLFAQDRVWQSGKQTVVRGAVGLAIQPSTLQSVPTVNDRRDTMIESLAARYAAEYQAKRALEKPSSRQNTLPKFPWPTVQIPEDSWASDFDQLEQEVLGSSDQWKVSDNLDAPHVDWQSESFHQQYWELDSVLQGLEDPNKFNSSHPHQENRIHY